MMYWMIILCAVFPDSCDLVTFNRRASKSLKEGNAPMTPPELQVSMDCVIPAIVKTITITPNGNSPEAEMSRTPSVYLPDHLDTITSESNEENKIFTNDTDGLKKYQTKLALNERYRRLIPYMTFYYANDLITRGKYEAKNIEVGKAEITQNAPVTPNERVPKVVYVSQMHKNIPRYFGNRLTQYNIASSNPSKLYYKVGSPATYQQPQKITNHNPVYQEPNTFEYSDRTYERLIPKYNKPLNDHYHSARKPHVLQNEDTDNVQYYSGEKAETPLFKLVPYEQTPPVIVSLPHKYRPMSQNEYDTTNTVANDHVFIKPRPNLSQHIPYNSGVKQEGIRTPTTVSETYYEQRPKSIIVENGFILENNPSVTSALQYSQKDGIGYLNLNNNKQEDEVNQEYVTFGPKYIENNLHDIQPESSPVTISSVIHSLRLNKPIPKANTSNNVGASIKTLLRVLNTLNVMSQSTSVDSSVANTESTNKPYVPAKIFATTSKPILSTLDPHELEFQEEPYLAPVNTPSQHLDDTPNPGGTSQRFPLPIHSDDEGGTPGKPGIDYPILTVIPETSFNCKTQRYKGFFADPETRCQVWHYCDLNGGQASFLCPNGTIFSQAGLTCDWWFNVRCASTAQLYVLNESLYKFILPHSPKFPEDYSGPLVDKYLSLKFKEMEEQFKKNKKGSAEDKSDSDESTGKDVESSTEKQALESAIVQGHVSVQTAGRSGNVERLHEDSTTSNV